MLLTPHTFTENEVTEFMSKREKISRISEKIEILVATLLFLTMLISCGLYIDIKINGKSSNLPALSSADKRTLLRTVATDSHSSFSDDLIEPVFVGVKNGESKICACPVILSRRSVENSVYQSLRLLFSGTNEEISFETDEKREEYIANLKDSRNYMLMSFYNDIPSLAFLPCLSESYETRSNLSLFYVRHLFLMPDVDGNLFAISVSSDKKINVIYPLQDTKFNKISAETYDVSDGYSYFEFEDDGITPVLTSSFMSAKYSQNSCAEIYSTEKSAEWITNLFVVFSMNTSLVKDYAVKDLASGENTDTYFVEDELEIIVSTDGLVRFDASQNSGVDLDNYLGYRSRQESGYTFGDKIFAVKSIVNRLNYCDTLANYCIVGVDYEKENDVFSVYLKRFVNGISVSENEYDAVFEIRNDLLTYASFPATEIKALDDYTVIIPQKYANAVIDEEVPDDSEKISALSFACLSKDMEQEKTYVLKWAKKFDFSEVDE